VANTEDNVRTCTNTEELENVLEFMDCVEDTNSGISSRTAAGYTEACHADVDKVLGEDSVHVEKSDGGRNQCESNDNMSNLVKSGSSVQENQVVDSVMQLNILMMGQNSVDNESIMSCAELCHEGKSSAREDQISGETPPMSHDNNDLDYKVCPCPAEPSPVNNHVEKSSCDFYYEYGDWKVLWDQFYSRYYFYNIQTQESTWYPPHGLEDFASYCSTYSSEGTDEPVSQLTSTLVEEHNRINTKLEKSCAVSSCVDNTMDYCISKADQHVVQYGANMNPCDSGKTTFGKV
jgi:trimethylguanosine synthase